MLLYATFAGAMIPMGGWLASHENIHEKWLEQEFRHSVIAFGAGALLGAVALVLLPDGMDSLPGLFPVLFICLGAGIMAGLNALIARQGSSRGQMLAMLSDFAPEALALGAMFAARPKEAPLLALFIGLQNLPEGFNAYREAGEAQGEAAEGSDHRLRNFVLLALVGPTATLVGYFLLADLPFVTGAIMCGAAGSILFLMFQDIAPQVKLENRLGPPMAAVAGVALGMAGHALMGGL